MSQRLVKVAKELNVGTDSIVDYLSKKGYAIDAKPTSMITDEMHNLLLQEFSSNMAIKAQADNMVIGTRPPVKGAEVVTPVVHEVAVKEAPVAKPAEKAIKKAEVEEQDKPKLKVLGKIDLKPKAKEKAEEKPEVEVPAIAPEEIVAPPVLEELPDEVVRAEAPQ